MRRSVKIALWVAAFAACFGVGAYVAAHTDPFPPGVEDPGTRDLDVPASATPQPGAWPLGLTTRTYHDLYVGGRCAANWRVEVVLDVVDRAVTGSGTATRKGHLRCDEPTAQVQAERVGFDASGTSAAGTLRFRLTPTTRSPAGSQELSGLVKTVPTLRFRLPADAGATASFDVTVPDGDRGTYGAVGRIVITDPTTG